MSDPFPEEAYVTPEARVAAPVERVLPKPPAYIPRAEAWAEYSVPMPAWARHFARAGRGAPPACPDMANATGDAWDAHKEEANRRYWAHWRGLVRQMTALKASAALVVLRQGATSPLGRAAAALAFDVDEEWQRLRVLRDKGAPLQIRVFQAIDGVPRPADEAPARRTLFDPALAAAGDDQSDILDAMG